MKNKDKKLDSLLQKNTTEQLKRVDWEKLHQSIINDLDAAEQHKLRQTKKLYKLKIAAGFAAAACLLISLSLIFKFESRKQSDKQINEIFSAYYTKAATPTEESMLASTNPDYILLTGKLYLFENDPLLKPHSVWQQQLVIKNGNHTLNNGG